METYVIALAPVMGTAFLAYCAWTIKMILDVSKIQAATVAKLDAVQENTVHTAARVDALVSARFS